MSEDNQYITASREAAKEYDSRIFWLCGGTIALSLTFFQDLTKRTSLVDGSLTYFIFGGIFLLAAIAAVMISFQLSIIACNAYAEYEETEKEKDYQLGIRCGKYIAKLNWAALLCTVIGIFLIGIFFVNNAGSYNNRKGMNNDETPRETAATAQSSSSSAP